MLTAYFRRHGWRYLPGTIFLVLCAYIQTRAPIALGAAIDLIGGDASPFFRQVIWMVLIALGIFITRILWRYFIIVGARELEVMLRNGLYEHIQRLPIDFYGRSRSGDMMAYAINDIGAVRMMFGPALAQTLNGISTIVFSIIAMAGEVDASLTLWALLPVPVAITVIVIVGQKVQVRFRRVQELFAAMSSHVNENISGMRVIKAFAQEKAQQESFQVESGDMRIAYTKLYDASTVLSPVIQGLFGISYAIGLILGGRLVVEGKIPIGAYTAFNSYLLLITSPVVQLGRIVTILKRGMVSYSRLKGVMDEKEVPLEEYEPDGEAIRGAIEARGLTFRYPGGERDALKDIHFSLPEGGVLGIVGPTGSGKSTLMLLLSKLLMPPKGSIFVGGRDMRDIPAASLRAASGYVPQDGFLFDASIRENIGFFETEDEARIMEAARIAGLAGDLEAMPEGLLTNVGERGGHLSGGQRQRVCLARALVKDPRILLLDDTLSAVDTRTEGRILAALRGELKGRTAVIVSHRLSAVMEADEILYMENGAVKERGTHDQLLALGGAYAALHRQQQAGEGAAI